MSKKPAKSDGDVRKLTDEEVGIELKRVRGELYALRTQQVTGKVDDNSKFGKNRRSIARLLTESNARLHKKAAPKGAKKTAGKAVAAKPAPKSVKPVAKKKAAK